MGTRTVFLFAALALLSPAAISAQETSPSSAAGNLLAQVKWLRLEVVGGRIVVKSDRCPHSRHVVELSPAEGAKQTLSFESKARELILRYEEHSSSASVLLELNERGQLTISHTAAQLPETLVRYVQPRMGQVSLTMAGETAKKSTATDLWQLLICERELCVKHLLPVLNHLRADWDLAAQLTAVEATVIARAGADVLAQERAWQRLVDELGSPSFARRQAADLALRSGGQGVLATLRQLDFGGLDVEQQRRVRAILIDLADSGPDSEERVSDWLCGDKRVWLALLDRGDISQRVAAAQHLGMLCRRPISFDPHASADERSAQLAELAAKLAPR